MDKIKSLEDLKRIREEALKQKSAKSTAGQIQIIVGMGTVGIAAGARETMKAILDFIEKEKLTDIVVRQTGYAKWDSFEPIVQVVIGDQPMVTYGKVNSDAVTRIMESHVVGGKIVDDLVIED
ncbi:MAG: (2Fe-2S) ferredoxin domain-containing protein [Anaerolineae bacterium]|jgi:NADP-reducing hydrogenase subunit HndB|nr:(2Fe-2S) ferredoxin domain-containing protein [Anaerolineae bacterium]